MGKIRFLIILFLICSLQSFAVEKAVMHLPYDKMDSPVLFGSRIVDVNRPNGKVYAQGQHNAFPVLMNIEQTPDGFIIFSPDRSAEVAQFGRSRKHGHPIRFKIMQTMKDGSFLLDVSNYFATYPSQISVVPAHDLEKEVQIASNILHVMQTPEYLEVLARYTYASGLEVTAACYMIFLSKRPMKGEKLDPTKVGYNGKQYSQRWNLSRRGSAIHFYVDKAFPKEWYPYIKEGIEDWNKAFEAAGLGKVIYVHPEYAGMDRYSPLVNMVRYMDVNEANAKGDVLVDPRSGEILQGDILWWKNVTDLIKDWRYLQTGASDPAARLEKYSIKDLGPMIRYSVCHEMGHVLGLSHNMGGSWAYPIDSLRSPSFTKKYGTTASVMDYARYNHIATADDVAAGVSLLPPRLGPYDYYAIQCGYGFKKQKPGEYCYFAPMISAAISPDPSSQSESLGNDLLASSAAGIRNCKRLLNLNGLTPRRRNLVSKQYYRYLWLAMSNIGGSVNGVPVPEDKQARTMAFVFADLSSVPPEIYNKEQEDIILAEFEGNFLPKRVKETLGEKGLRRYNTRLKGLKRKYNYNQ